MKKYKVLVFGSGARENAIAFKISQSPLLEKLFLALPNDGFKNLGEEIYFDNFEDLAQKCISNNINLAVIGPEAPLAEGLVDVFNKHGVKCIGSDKKWSRLESSKKYAKEFMVKHNIPTATYVTVKSEEGIEKAVSNFSVPPVLKADGLAAGKGVYLSESMDDAKNMLKEFLSGKFGEASHAVVLEERLEGEELSVIALWDGKTLLPLVTARDYKRLYDSQVGPNTGGMGAYCPVKISNEQENDLKKYLLQLEKALLEENADFSGVIYSGLMLTKDGIKVLEYNMRFGDPETQPLMCHLESDILEVFIKATEKKLSEVKLEWKNGSTIGVVVASEGYPENPKKGCPINNLEKATENNGTQVFYAGVKKSEQQLVSNGGRVLTICASGENIEEIRKKIYKTIEQIDFSDKIYRTDIGK